MRHTPDDYRRCAEAGMTMAQTAAKLNVGDDCVSRAARTHGLTFTKAKMGRPRRALCAALDGKETRAEIVKLLRRPSTANDLARALSLTQQAVSRELSKLRKMGIACVSEVIHGVSIWELDHTTEKGAAQ